jgi:MFS family permease
VFARLVELRRGLPPAFWLVWLGTLVNRAGGFVLPMLGYYLTEERGLSRGAAVAIGTCYGAGAMVAGIAGGVLADRLGRRRTMALSLLGGAATMLALAEARTPTTIGAAAAALGLVGELYRPAVMAFVADVVPAADRPRAFGALYWAINLGFTVAPLAAGALAGWSYRALFIGDAATMAIYGLIVLARLPEARPVVTAADPPAVSLATVLRDRVFMVFVGLTLATALVFHQSTLTLSVHLAHQGYAASTYGAIVAVNGVLIIAVQPWLAAWATRHDSTRVLVAAALLCGVGFGMHGLGAAVPLHVAAVVVWTLGEILQSPFYGTVVSTLAPPTARGRYQGVFSVAFGMAAMGAPSTGQAAVAVAGPRGPWLACVILAAAAALGLGASAAGRRARGVR